MPSLTKNEERLWNKAKEQGKAEDYAYIMGIFEKMTGRTASASRVASRWLQAYVPGTKIPEGTGWTPGQVTPMFSGTEPIKEKGTGSQTPPPRDRNGKPNPPEDLGVMEIPGYKWQNR